MYRWSLTLLLLALANATAGRLSAQATAPSLEIEDRAFDFGERHQYEIVEHAFAVRNTGSAAETPRIEAFSTAAEVRVEPPTLSPGESGKIYVRQPIGNRLGQTSFRLRVRGSGAAGFEAKLRLAGFVESAYDPERIVLDYGRVDVATGATADLAVASREVARLEVAGLDGETAAQIAWEATPVVPLSPGGPLGRIRLLPGLPLGTLERAVRLRTNVALQPWLEVLVRAEIVGAILPERPSFDLGAVRVGEPTEASMELRHRSGLAFRVAAVEGAQSGASASAEPCAGGNPAIAQACWKLRLRVQAAATGQISGALRVRVEGQSESIPIGFAAMAIAPGTEVRTMTLPGPGTLALPGGTDDPPDPFGGLLQRSSPAEATPPGAPAQATGAAQISHRRLVALTWKTTRETGLYGFLIYRSESRAGPFLRQSATIVRASNEAAETHAYRYEDTEVENGKTYWYYIDAVTTAGKKLGFSGVLGRTIAADATP